MNTKAKTASLRTMYALDHHAQVLKPVVMTLQHSLDFSGIEHSVGSWKGGANSTYISVVGNSGRRHKFYLKGIVRPVPGIEIRSSARGIVLFKLSNDRDVLRFIKHLESL